MASDGSRKSYSGKSKKSSQLLSKEEEFLYVCLFCQIQLSIPDSQFTLTGLVSSNFK